MKGVPQMNQVFRTAEYQVLLRQYPIVYSVDMHDENCYGYMIDTKSGELLEDCNIVGKPSVFYSHVDKHHLSRKDNMVILFEAGALGFSPYRKLTKAGYTCRMIAPSSIPRPPKRQKTDRWDAINNLHYFMAGSLRFVNAPAEEDVDAREWLRYRQELNHSVTKQKQRILGFLKRHACEYTLTKTNWTQRHRRWLRSVALADLVRGLLDLELDHLAYFEDQLAKIDRSLDNFFSSNERYCQQATTYQRIAGIGRIGAMTLVLEAGDLSRFSHPNAIMNFFGLVPGKHSSGASDPSLHITKAGNTYVRQALVTAARAYRDRRLLRTKKYIQSLPEPMQEFINRLQERLYNRYHDLRQKGKHGNKAKCAVARELCGFLWELCTTTLPQITKPESLQKKAA
jgi:transposase